MEAYFWNIFMILMGTIAIIFSFLTHRIQSRLKRNGLLEEAKMIYFSTEKSTGDSPSLTIPVFTFSHKDQNGIKTYTVKGKSNSLCKIGEVTPIYYNPENPEKEYFLPKKDFLVKYLMFFIGMFFVCLGVLYLMKNLNYPTENYFLYLIIGLFSGTFLLFSIGKIADAINRK
ncbi:DUF3592 domain-containing protein [Flavobacterium sp. AC]|uniref:DUF3592 domain-containing protein n=1 Tax=Flavobacterium azizsancarii TaxID=2961580 RepID=A0ABT4W775_9FLAO|nr:DUF3592 domain-containing protein [Flavobacterium azizsancarii]MDA6068408.1 DUF3592 domain-containing protein [Flavobacterium azizsancarii]